MFKFIFLRSCQLFFRTGKCDLCNMITAVQPGKLVASSGMIQGYDLCICPTAVLFLVDQVMAVRHCGDLRQMGHAHDLLSRGNGEEQESRSCA